MSFRTYLKEFAPRIAGVLFLGAVATGGLVVVADATDYNERLDRAYALAESYCDQTLGDGEYQLYTANVVGGHGGLHCDTYDKPGSVAVHLHEIPIEYQQQALEAERAGESLGWSRGTIEKHREPTGLFDNAFLGAFVTVFVGAVILAIAQRVRYRGASDD